MHMLAVLCLAIYYYILCLAVGNSWDTQLVTQCTRYMYMYMYSVHVHVWCA